MVIRLDLLTDFLTEPHGALMRPNYLASMFRSLGLVVIAEVTVLAALVVLGSWVVTLAR
jgi:hypothetical protein